MIKIKGEFENGAQMRQELMSLLGLDGNHVISASISGKDVIIERPQATEEQIAEVKEAFAEIQAPPVEEKKKRRTKAEIEAEAEALKANTGAEEPPASVENVTPIVADEPVKEEVSAPVAEGPKFTVDDAKLAAAKLARAGFRDEAKNIAYKYAVITNPSVSKDATGLVALIAAENLQDFITEIEAVNK